MLSMFYVILHRIVIKRWQAEKFSFYSNKSQRSWWFVNTWLISNCQWRNYSGNSINDQINRLHSRNGPILHNRVESSLKGANWQFLVYRLGPIEACVARLRGIYTRYMSYNLVYRWNVWIISSLHILKSNQSNISATLRCKQFNSSVK